MKAQHIAGTECEFAPLARTDGYLPIEDYGLISDGETAALVGRDGAIAWLCVPRFDSPPLFCELLDRRRGGNFSITLPQVSEARQRYEGDSGVLVTEMRGAGGLLRIRDALTVTPGANLREDTPAHESELIREVHSLAGDLDVHVQVQPRGDPECHRAPGGLRIVSARAPDVDLRLLCTAPLDGLVTTLRLKAGERVVFALRWGPAGDREAAIDLDPLAATKNAWARWAGCLRYAGPQAPLVRRSAIVLKMLDRWSNGAIVAAPTSSLPEAIGGPRNWDYRYVWIRDAAFSVYALHRIGMVREAKGFLGWVLDAVGRDGRPRVLYDLDGKAPRPECEDPELEGYRRSPPVRWGNAAADQMQHDVYGEILDVAYQWSQHVGRIDEALWARLQPLAEAAAKAWQTPDHGIWEIRTSGRPFTYSAAMCHAALDRGIRIARRFGLPCDTRRWETEAQRIRSAILDDAWSAELQAITESLGGRSLDASILALPLRRVVRADHPKMIATTRAVVDRLGAGSGLLYRYIPEDSPDGLPGHEGAFLLCSFWLVDNLAKQGRLDEAMSLFESLCARASPLGLLPEQIDPPTGAFLGNFPQAFSHIGLISSGVNLARALPGEGARP
jgi:alpha,alpha-trehalase